MCCKDTLTDISETIAKTAKEAFGDKFDSAVLYGSYARGDFDDGSDIDIMILANIPRAELACYKKKFSRLTSELGLKYDVVITVTLKDSETFYKFQNTVPFYSNIQKEGIRIAV